MTWWLWLIGVAWSVLSVVLIVWWARERYGDPFDEVGSFVFWTIVITAIPVALAFLAHFDPGSDSPPSKTRTCTIQQMQQVRVGKTYENEWVCIGWEQQ